MNNPDSQRWKRSVRRGVALALALALIGFAALVVYAGGPATVASAFTHASPVWLALALGGVALEWALDAARFAIAGRVYDFRAPFAFWCRLAIANLSAAYAANLGPPASAWLLGRRGMPAGEAMALSVAKQMLFFPAALGPTWLLVTLAPGFAPAGPVRHTLALMGTLCVALFLVVLVLARSPDRALALVDRVSQRGGRTPIEGFLRAMRAFFYERPGLLVASTLLAVLNQAAIVLTVMALLCAFGGDGTPASAWARAYLFSTVSQTAPTPGGAGLTEAGGVLLFRGLLGAGELASFLVLARTLTVQLPIVVGALVLAGEARRDA